MLIPVLIVLCLLGVVNASTNTGAQNAAVPIIYMSNCSSVDLVEVNGVLVNDSMTLLGGQSFFYNYTNTSTIGLYTYSVDPDCIVCTNNACTGEFRITPNGETLDTASSLIQIFLLFFFSSFLVCFYIVKKDIDFDSWYKRIVTRYKGKNSPRVVLSGMGYSLMKESFLVYYLLLLPVVLLTLNIITVYNVGDLIPYTDIILIGYGVGLVVIGVVFLGKLQEFLSNVIEQTKDFNWGVGE